MNSWNSAVREFYENLPLHWLIFKMDFDNENAALGQRKLGRKGRKAAFGLDRNLSSLALLRLLELLSFFIIWFCYLYFWSPAAIINACLYGSIRKKQICQEKCVH